MGSKLSFRGYVFLVRVRVRVLVCLAVGPESVSAYGGSVLTFSSSRFSTARLSCSFKSARPRRNDARGVLGESYGHGWLTVSSSSLNP
ncbi:hypothetical protein BGZ61DRAFT_463954 [Ilyonectria robusta]|uniref:uncharacterized protein n=1 Tax=Ilyonectria robusta TaxID=1079257 RepID=UPI001E8EA7EF|nr:uncharacterized protein BGZ61DRAFT_463954 [Ilyonectria robusta]KAH8661293.1 hypothetical protein BGZ61DRAFT_463954 [Ilyonectria robusta]